MLMALLLMTINPASASAPRTRPLTPVVLFPGGATTRMDVIIHNQTVAPDCPASGTFQLNFFAAPSPDFSQVCQDKLATLVVKFDARGKPHFANQEGVKVKIVTYGKTESVLWYDGLFAYLEQAGYTRNVNIRVAGFDYRLTPDLDGFVERTAELIEETYSHNHNTPVHLVAQSLGTDYAQYFITHVPQQWKNKYIHGYTILVESWPGNGYNIELLFFGTNWQDFSNPATLENAASSTAMWESFPSTYMQLADPAWFGNREVLIHDTSTDKQYTPMDYTQLFADAGLKLAPKIAPYYIGLIKFQAPFYPNVDVYAEKGSGLQTAVGMEVPNLKVGQLFAAAPVFFWRDGDSLQEDITNSAIYALQSMPCYHFEVHDNPGVDHISIGVNDPEVWGRLVADAQLPRSK